MTRRKTAAERELITQVELLQHRRADLMRQIDAIDPLIKMLWTRINALSEARK